MKKIALLCCLGLFFAACSNSSEQKEEKQAEENVNAVMKSDQERMDSMRKAIEAQMEKVSDDTLVQKKYSQ